MSIFRRICKLADLMTQVERRTCPAGSQRSTIHSLQAGNSVRLAQSSFSKSSRAVSKVPSGMCITCESQHDRRTRPGQVSCNLHWNRCRCAPRVLSSHVLAEVLCLGTSCLRHYSSTNSLCNEVWRNGTMVHERGW